MAPLNSGHKGFVTKVRQKVWPLLNMFIVYTIHKNPVNVADAQAGYKVIKLVEQHHMFSC